MHPHINLSSNGMKIIRINSKNVVYVILVLLLSTVKQAHMGEYGESMLVTFASKGTTENTTPAHSKKDDISESCPAGSQCSELSGDCLNCGLNTSCIYGSSYTAECSVLNGIDCVGELTFERNYTCRYCYQTEHWEHDCLQKRTCSSVASPQQFYLSNCTVHKDIICLGRRKFMKNLRCNFTSGYRWSTALILSITLGGFGADRFYLGHWQEGIGKLFSFGGLGVWTLIDVMLISMRYLGPADGSLYI